MILRIAGVLCAATLIITAAAAEPAVEGKAPAPASETAVPAAKVAESKDAKPAPRLVKPDDLVCRNEEVTGTRLTRRVCMTRAERAERSGRDRQTLEGIQRQGSGSRELPAGG